MSIKPEHVRAALMSAFGKGLKFPSVDLEEYVAKFLNGITPCKKVIGACGVMVPHNKADCL